MTVIPPKKAVILSDRRESKDLRLLLPLSLLLLLPLPLPSIRISVIRSERSVVEGDLRLRLLLLFKVHSSNPACLLCAGCPGPSHLGTGEVVRQCEPPASICPGGAG